METGALGQLMKAISVLQFIIFLLSVVNAQDFFINLPPLGPKGHFSPIQSGDSVRCRQSNRVGIHIVRILL